MGLLGTLFSRAPRESIALIDIASGSIGIGYAHLDEAGAVSLAYAARVPVERTPEEALEAAMLRTLAFAGAKLVREGGPLLLRSTGSPLAGRALVAIGAPWQETSVVTERVEEAAPFTFTHSLERSLLDRAKKIPAHRMLSHETVVATVLDGYATKNPYGKRAKKADVVLLTSTVDATLARTIGQTLKPHIRGAVPEVAAFAPLAFDVFRSLYPHEKSYLILEASNEATELVFVERGLLAAVLTAPVGVRAILNSRGKHSPLTSDMLPAEGVRVERRAGEAATSKNVWVDGVVAAVKGFSAEHPLPRTIFLVADDGVRDYLKNALDGETVRSLWLSSDPLTIVPFTAGQLASRVRAGQGARPDMALMLLSLFHRSNRGAPLTE